MACRTLLLVSVNRYVTPSPVYPLAMARLSAAVEGAGHRVFQFDVLVHGLDALPGVVNDVRPDLIGISIRNIHSTNSSIPYPCANGYREAIKTVRSCSSAPVVLGGSGFSLFPRVLMGELGADYGIVGPGEDALCSLLGALDGDGGRAQGGIPGVMVGQEGPPVALGGAGSGSRMRVQTSHDPYLVGEYWNSSGIIGVQTKRGCPRNCIYCTYPLIDGRQVTSAEPGEVADELEKLTRDHAVRYVFFTDSVFNLRSEDEIALAEEICRRELSLSWGAYFCPSGITPEYLTILRKSGLTHLEFGTDSLCDEVLDSYGKGFDVEGVVDISAMCVDLGLHYCHFVVFGGPGENMGTIRQTVTNSKRMKRALFFPCIGMQVYPNTRLHRMHNAEHSMTDEEYLSPVFYLAPGLDYDTIAEIIEKEKSRENYWVTQSDYTRLARAMTRMRETGRVGPLWELLVR